MIRIDRASGFVPASPWMPTPVLGAPEVRTPKEPLRPTRVLAQTVVMTPEQIQTQGYLEEARAQLASVEANQADLVIAIGAENTQQALNEARASVAMYENQRAAGV